MSKKSYSYIRFSTPEQIKGDSLRRQLEGSRQWADENDYELDTSLRDMQSLVKQRLAIDPIQVR